MKKIIELIKSFINPIPPEKSFDELAVAAGIGEADLKLLRNSMGGVSWRFDDGAEEPKKGKNTRVDSKETRVQPIQRIQPIERNSGFGRDE